MSATSLEFYAMPSEQRRWLQDVLRDQNVWCYARRWPDVYWAVESGDLPLDHEFVGSDWSDFGLFIGRRDLTPSPIWEETGAGKQINFVPSLAVAYRPSLIAHTEVLLEGQMAIMRAVSYDDARIDASVLQHWYKQLAKSFKALRTSGAALIQHTTLGTIKEWPKVIVTPGAVEWRHAGRRLKQFVGGTVEFDVKISDVGSDNVKGIT